MHSAQPRMTFEQRSCLTKKRYQLQPICTLNQYAYPCEFCGGWHKATKKDETDDA